MPMPRELNLALGIARIVQQEMQAQIINPLLKLGTKRAYRRRKAKAVVEPVTPLQRRRA